MDEMMNGVAETPTTGSVSNSVPDNTGVNIDHVDGNGNVILPSLYTTDEQLSEDLTQSEQPQEQVEQPVPEVEPEYIDLGYTKVRKDKIGDLWSEKDRFIQEQNKRISELESKVSIPESSSAPVGEQSTPQQSFDTDYLDKIGREVVSKFGYQDVVQDDAASVIGLQVDIAKRVFQEQFNEMQEQQKRQSLDSEFIAAQQEIERSYADYRNDPLWIGCVVKTQRSGGRPTDAKNLYLQMKGKAPTAPLPTETVQSANQAIQRNNPLPMPSTGYARPQNQMYDAAAVAAQNLYRRLVPNATKEELDAVARESMMN